MSSAGFRVVVVLSIVAALVAAGIVLFVRIPAPNPAPDPPPEEIPAPGFTDSPHFTTRSDAKYVGIAACKECHPSQHGSYLHTTHSRALAEVDPKTEPPDGEYHHAESGRTYRVFRKDGRMRHEEVMKASDGRVIARTDLPVKYLIGSGHFARTYAVEADGFLSESPITWYSQQAKWSMSPGFDMAGHAGFVRPVTAECLVCHAGRVEHVSGTSTGAQVLERPIGCESCHGPGSHHVAHHRSVKHEPGKPDPTIVHPGRISRPLLESICSSCHLQTTAAVDVRGRSLLDFRPGRPLSDYRIYYVADGDDEQMRVVGHIEQLRQSACYKGAEGFSCLTCHDPHLAAKPADSAAHYRKKCMDCHEKKGCSLAPAERLKRDPTDGCIACHMPRGDTDIPHVAFTHHRVGIHKKAAAPPAPATKVAGLRPLDENANLTAPDRDRNLGLAYLSLAHKAPTAEAGRAYGDGAFDALARAHRAGIRDGETLVSLASLHFNRGESDRAVEFAKLGLAARDLTASTRVDAVKIVVQDLMKREAYDEAIPLLEALTKQRREPDDSRLLAMCYLETGRTADAIHSLERSLLIAPTDARIHAMLASAQERTGNRAKAEEHRRTAEWLENHRKR